MKEDTKEQEILDLEGAAAFLRCSAKKMRVLFKSGEIPARKAGYGWIVTRRALLAWVDGENNGESQEKG